MHLHRGAAQRIVEHITANLDLQVWVADPSSQILARSQEPEREAGQQLSSPNNLDEIVLHSRCGYQRFPLHYGDELVGILIVCGDQQEEAVANVAKVMAELIIRQAMDIEQLIDQQWALNRFVYDLLFANFREKPEAIILQEAKLLSIDLTAPRVIGVVDVAAWLDKLQCKTSYPTPAVNGYRRQRNQLRRQLLRTARECLSSNEETVYAFLDEKQFVVLAAIDPAVDADWRRQLERALQNFLDELQQPTGVLLTAGLGDYYPAWQELPSSYHDAQFALERGQVLYGSGKVFTVADLGLAAFVCADDPTTSARLAAQLVHSLHEWPELLETLDVFLSANLSPSRAAQQLQIHRHTLTYRLGKIADITGLNPQEFSAATQFYAALLWRRLAPATPPRR